MKLTTKAKVSNPALDIHKSNVIDIVTQLAIAGSTYRSIVFAKRTGMYSCTSAFRVGNFTFGSRRITNRRSQGLSTTANVS
jgi:hypothetical protein